MIPFPNDQVVRELWNPIPDRRFYLYVPDRRKKFKRRWRQYPQSRRK